MSMCNYASLTEAEKAKYHNQIKKCADAFGGNNFFLQLLEALRETKPHPLISGSREFRFDLGVIKWNKVIFKDKLKLLMEIRLTQSENGTLIPSKDAKNYKKVMNLLRTIKPIAFSVSTDDAMVGEGFTVHPFEVIGDNITRLDPIFDALFFCSIDTVKKLLNYPK